MADKIKGTEEFLDEIIDFIKALPDDEKASFACQATFQAALWGGINHVEMLGILECAKADITKFVVYPENDEEDGDEWKKLINNN